MIFIEFILLLLKQILFLLLFQNDMEKRNQRNR